MEDQVIRLILQQLGFEGLNTLRADAAKLKAGLEELPASYKRGEISAAQLEKQSATLGKEYERLTGLIGRMEAEQASQAAALAKGTSATQSWASSVTSASTAGSAWGAVIKNAGESAAETTRKIAAWADENRKLGQSQSLVSAGHTRIAAAAATAGDGTQRARQGIVDISRAAQDFAQGGFPAIVNNLEGIGRGIPAILEKPAEILKSLPALATLAGVGLLVLGPPLLQLARDFGIFGKAAEDAKGDVGRLQERIKELESKPHLIPIEILELENARKEVEAIKSALQAVENLRKTQATPEAESGKAITSAIAESTTDAGKHLGAEAFTAKLLSDMVTEMQAREDERARNEQRPIREQLEALEKLNEGGRDPGGEAMRVKLRTELAAAVKRATAARTAITTGADAETPALADKALGDILKAAQTGQGEAQKAGREALAKRAKAAGFVGLGEEIEEATPDTIRQQREGQEISERRQKAIEDRKAVEKKRQDEANRADAERRRLNAASIADQEREQAEALSLTRQTFGDELKEKALAGLKGGIDREKLKADLKAGLRAQLAQANDFREPVQQAVAEELVNSIVRTTTRSDVIKAQAADALKNNRNLKKDQTAAQKEASGIADFLSKNTDVDERAALLTANVRQQGGVNGRRMNAEQQRRYIENEIARYLVQNRLAGGQNAQIAAEALAADAARADDARRLAQRAPNPGRRGGVRQNGFPSVPASDPAASQAVRAAGVGVGNTQALASVGAQHNVQIGALISTVASQRQVIERVIRDTAVNTRSLQRLGR